MLGLRAGARLDRPAGEATRFEITALCSWSPSECGNAAGPVRTTKRSGDSDLPDVPARSSVELLTRYRCVVRRRPEWTSVKLEGGEHHGGLGDLPATWRAACRPEVGGPFGGPRGSRGAGSAPATMVHLRDRGYRDDDGLAR